MDPRVYYSCQCKDTSYSYKLCYLCASFIIIHSLHVGETSYLTFGMKHFNSPFEPCLILKTFPKKIIFLVLRNNIKVQELLAKRILYLFCKAFSYAFYFHSSIFFHVLGFLKTQYDACSTFWS